MVLNETVTPLERILEWMRTSGEVGHLDYYDFFVYRGDLLLRELLYKKFKDEDGDFRIDWMNKRDKATLNNLSLKISRYEMNFINTPVYDKIVEEFGENLPEFLKDTKRDSKGRWTDLEIAQGWYQNVSGDLFHYDGVVWDSVPAESIKDLEFLG